MPTYVYETLEEAHPQQFEFIQAMSEKPFTQHPQTGVAIQRIIVPGAAVKVRGLKKGAKVNKLSPAATACGCASSGMRFANKKQCGH